MEVWKQGWLFNSVRGTQEGLDSKMVELTPKLLKGQHTGAVSEAKAGESQSLLMKDFQL